MKKRTLLLGALLATLLSGAKADVDPNFYIYICFGQSNMEGNAQWESMDNTVEPNHRFRLLATCKFSNPARTMGQWYDAKPPLVSPTGKLGPSDYFGHTMAAALPENVRIGVIPVAIGGCKIEMFDKSKYKTEINKGDYSAGLANQHYGGNPYKRIIDMAKKAQEAGVIKGILLHQGCSNTGDPNWPDMVKKIYNDILTDLGLKAVDVPLFVGEVEYKGAGTNSDSGACSGHNTQVARIPSVIPTGHVVSAKDVPGNNVDPWHFSALGYRMLGKRYALEVLKTMGLDAKPDAQYTMPQALAKFYGAKSITAASNGVIVPGSKIAVTATFNDNHKEDVSDYVTFSSNDVLIQNGKIVGAGEGEVQVAYTDFCNHTTTAILNLTVSFFPMTADYLKPRQGTVKIDYDTRVLTFSTTNAQAGWLYDTPIDLSPYKYLVFKLKEPQVTDAEIRLFRRTGSSLSLGHREIIGDRTVVAIDLHKMKYSNKELDPSVIGKVVFHSPKKGVLALDDVFLSNDDTYAAYTTSIRDANGVESPFKAPLYSLDGRLAQPDVVKPGIYIRTGKKIFLRSYE